MSGVVTWMRLDPEVRQRVQALVDEGSADVGPTRKPTLSSMLAWLVETGLEQHEKKTARRTRKATR